MATLRSLTAQQPKTEAVREVVQPGALRPASVEAAIGIQVRAASLLGKYPDVSALHQSVRDAISHKTQPLRDQLQQRYDSWLDLQTYPDSQLIQAPDLLRKQLREMATSIERLPDLERSMVPSPQLANSGETNAPAPADAAISWESSLFYLLGATFIVLILMRVLIPRSILDREISAHRDDQKSEDNVNGSQTGGNNLGNGLLRFVSWILENSGFIGMIIGLFVLSTEKVRPGRKGAHPEDDEGRSYHSRNHDSYGAQTPHKRATDDRRPYATQTKAGPRRTTNLAGTITKRTLKDRNYRVIGYIETKSDGTEIGKNAAYKVVGYYDPAKNQTKDRNYRIVGYGNMLDMLVITGGG